MVDWICPECGGEVSAEIPQCPTCSPDQGISLSGRAVVQGNRAQHGAQQHGRTQQHGKENGKPRSASSTGSNAIAASNSTGSNSTGSNVAVAPPPTRPSRLPGNGVHALAAAVEHPVSDQPESGYSAAERATDRVTDRVESNGSNHRTATAEWEAEERRVRRVPRTDEVPPVAVAPPAAIAPPRIARVPPEPPEPGAVEFVDPNQLTFDWGWSEEPAVAVEAREEPVPPAMVPLPVEPEAAMPPTPVAAQEAAAPDLETVEPGSVAEATPASESAQVGEPEPSVQPIPALEQVLERTLERSLARANDVLNDAVKDPEPAFRLVELKPHEVLREGREPRPAVLEAVGFPERAPERPQLQAAPAAEKIREVEPEVPAREVAKSGVAAPEVSAEEMAATTVSAPDISGDAESDDEIGVPAIQTSTLLQLPVECASKKPGPTGPQPDPASDWVDPVPSLVPEENPSWTQTPVATVYPAKARSVEVPLRKAARGPDEPRRDRDLRDNPQAADWVEWPVAASAEWPVSRDAVALSRIEPAWAEPAANLKIREPRPVDAKLKPSQSGLAWAWPLPDSASAGKLLGSSGRLDGVELAGGKPPFWSSMANYQAVAFSRMRWQAPTVSMLRPDVTEMIQEHLPGPSLPPELVRLHGVSVVVGPMKKVKKAASGGGGGSWVLTFLVAATVITGALSLTMFAVPQFFEPAAPVAEPAGKGTPDKGQAEKAKAAPVAAAATPAPHEPWRAIEVTGFRLVTLAGGSGEIHYILVNHDPKPVANPNLEVTLWDSSHGAQPLSRFVVRAPRLGAYESREMVSRIANLPASLQMPDWQNLRVDVAQAR